MFNLSTHIRARQCTIALRVFVILLVLAQPAMGEGLVATINGARLAVNDEGVGRPVVLLHGGFMDSTMWDAQAAALSKEFRVIRFDFRGYGRSEKPTSPYRPTDDIAALLDHLNVPSAAFVGISMGGAIAIEFALSHPDRTACLILGEAGLRGYQWSADVIDTMNAVETVAKERGREAAIEVFLGRPVFSSAKSDSAAYAAIRAQLLRNFSLEDNQMLAESPSAVGRLSEIRVPTLVLIAELGGPDARAIGAKIANEVAHAKLVTLEGSGHMMNFEQPEIFNRVVLEFLSSNAAADDFLGCDGQKGAVQSTSYIPSKNSGSASTQPSSPDSRRT